MLIGLYRSKEELEHCIGHPLHFESGNLLVDDYRPFGTVAVRGPTDPGHPSWWAEVTLIGGRIVRVD